MQAPKPKTVIDLANEVATDGWRQTTADRLSSYLDDESSAVLDKSWKANHCKKLAKAANRLEQLSGQFTHLDSVLASQQAREAVSCSEFGTALLRQAISVHFQTDKIASGIRTCGIMLCMINRCVEDCQCLKDLASGTTLPKIQSVIKENIDRLLLGA